MTQTPDFSPGLWGQSALTSGILGGGAHRPGKANLRLIRKAIRHGWPIPADKREALVRHFMAVITAKPRHDRNCLAAVRCVMEAHRINVREFDKLVKIVYGE